VRRDRQHRHPAALRVVQAVDQVQIARTAGDRADRQLAGERCVCGGREPRGLLVTDVFPRDFTGAPDGVGEPVEAVARQAVDAANAADPQC
jgi:hypothetical protein